MTGRHDHPGLYPHLPAREVDESTLDDYAPPGSEFRAAWEYVLSHQLTSSEGSAFWHGVNIQRESDAALIKALADLCEKVITVHANVQMDTPEDKALHAKAVDTFRACLRALLDGTP